MYEITAKMAISEAKRRAEDQIRSTISRAQLCVKNKISYSFGEKNPDIGLDCSGLVTYCVPGELLPNGVEKQFRHLALWIFKGEDIYYIDVGDLVFFAKKNKPEIVSHVGIIEKVNLHSTTIIHSSELRGGVVRDKFNLVQNTFREDYLILGIAKIYPFLFRYFLKDEINKEKKDAV